MIRSPFCLGIFACFLILSVAQGCGDGTGISSRREDGAGIPGQRSPGAGLTAEELVRRIEPSLVRIQARFSADAKDGELPAGTGFGTGIVFDRLGHVVTNDHVLLAPADRRLPKEIVVTTAGNKSFWAVLQGRDRATDLAVLRIEARDLVPAAFARPGDVRVGQEVLALGYALDLTGGPTVTRGIVSATRQSIYKEPYTIPDIIQTDAGINPGNSGGPLVNAKGEVIGINTAIVKEPGSPGFAISMALAEPVIRTLIRDGRIRRAFLGIGTVEATPAVAFRLGLTVETGVVVTLVAADSPAERAGLQQNDVVLEIAGRTIRSNGDLLAVLARHAPGESVPVRLVRGSKAIALVAVLGHPAE